jgi:Mce-associated membrane protein
VTTSAKSVANTDRGDDTIEEQEVAVTVETDPVTEDETKEAQDVAADKPQFDADKAVEPDDDADDADSAEDSDSQSADAKGVKRRITWTRLLVFGVLPGLVLLMALGAGYLKWRDSYVRLSEQARIESMRAATDGTVALLSYRPDTVDKDLVAARDRMTGTFRDSYTQLINDVVIPGAKQKQISAVATAPAAASVSANPQHAVVLVFVNQTIIVGKDAPSASASSVRVTLDNIDGHWLISGFDPV